MGTLKQNLYRRTKNNLIPLEFVSLLESLRSALGCEAVLADGWLEELVVKNEYVDADIDGVHLPSYKEALQRRWIAALSEMNPAAPRLPEFSDSQVKHEYKEVVSYATSRSKVFIERDAISSAFRLTASFGSGAVEYKAGWGEGFNGLKLDEDGIVTAFEEMRGSSSYRYRKPAYQSWLRTLIDEVGEEEAAETLRNALRRVQKVERKLERERRRREREAQQRRNSEKRTASDILSKVVFEDPDLKTLCTVYSIIADAVAEHGLHDLAVKYEEARKKVDGNAPELEIPEKPVLSSPPQRLRNR